MGAGARRAGLGGGGVDPSPAPEPSTPPTRSSDPAGRPAPERMGPCLELAALVRVRRTPDGMVPGLGRPDAGRRPGAARPVVAAQIPNPVVGPWIGAHGRDAGL